MGNIHLIDLQFLGLNKTIASFLIESSEGPILVETGPHSTIVAIEKGLAGRGYQLQDVKHVFLTHIHLDHAGAAWVFAEHGAKIYLHPFGGKNMQNPSRLMDSARRIYQEMTDPLWGQMKNISAEQLIEVDDNEVVTVGDCSMKAHYTPGHAKHHIAWELEDIVFTGDVAGVKIEHGMVAPPCPPPDINLEDWNDSIVRLRGLNAKAFYLTHFGRINNPDKQLDDLEFILNDWAMWVKAHWEKGETQEEMVKEFSAYAQEQLLSKGWDRKDLPLYEAANPAWMSVAGLVRYWSKKNM
ncbi:MAG: MBL fold metallo-hydrolase [Cyclobacteriaceae bacterium]